MEPLLPRLQDHPGVVADDSYADPMQVSERYSTVDQLGIGVGQSDVARRIQKQLQRDAAMTTAEEHDFSCCGEGLVQDSQNTSSPAPNQLAAVSSDLPAGSAILC